MSKSEHAAIAAAQKTMVETHNQLIGDSDTTYNATGSADIHMYLFGGKMEVDLTFQSGENRSFEGKFGGVGAGKGISNGTATFSIPPSQLTGDMSFQLTVGKNVEIKWYENGVILGVFVGDSADLRGGGEFGGRGSWS